MSDTQNTTPRNENLNFMTVDAFKEAIGATSLQVLRNPNTQKLFMASDKGQNFRVQGDIDTNEVMKILIEDGDLENACLVNTKPGADVIATL